MPNSTTKAIALREFTGGLWLNEGRPPNNKYYVRGLNLDVDTAGGLVKRRPIRQVAERTATTAAAGLYLDSKDPSTAGTNVSKASYFGHQTVKFNQNEFWTLVHEMGAVSKLDRWNISTGTLTSTTSLSSVSGLFFNCITEGNGNLYLGLTTDFTDRVTSGAVKTSLGIAVNDNLAAPTTGNMPNHAVAAVHLAYFFVANGANSSPLVMSRNTLRWSHPGQFESWRTNDTLSIGPSTEAILGLYSWREQLVIVKEHSCYVMTGYSPETFEVRLIHDFGAGAGDTNALPTTVGMQTAEVTPWGVFMYMAKRGIYLYDGHELKEVSGNLHDAFLDGRIPAAGTRLSWAGDRLVLHMTSAYTYNRALASYTSPSATAGFAWEYFPDKDYWTHHSYIVDDIVDVGYSSANTTITNYVSFTTWTNGSNKYGYSWSTWRGNLSGTAEGYQDTYINSTATKYQTHYRSPWIEPLASQVKRWRRPYIVMNPLPATGSAETDTTTVNFYRDYDGTGLVKVVKTGTIVRALTLATGSYYSSTYGWGHDGEQRDFDVPTKIIGGGRAVAVQLELISDSNKGYGWGLEEITFKVVPMRLK